MTSHFYFNDIVMMVLIPSEDKTWGRKFSLDFKDFNRKTWLDSRCKIEIQTGLAAAQN